MYILNQKKTVIIQTDNISEVVPLKKDTGKLLIKHQFTQLHTDYLYNIAELPEATDWGILVSNTHGRPRIIGTFETKERAQAVLNEIWLTPHNKKYEVPEK